MKITNVLDITKSGGILPQRTQSGRHQGHKALVVCHFFLYVLCAFLAISAVKFKLFF